MEISQILPIVSVTATDPDASEDNRDSAVFTFTRTGSTSQDLTVYYTLNGSATPGTLDEQGNPTPEDADYTGPTPDPAHEGLFKITIPARQASKTVECQPRNDALAEGSETIEVLLVASPFDQLSYQVPAQNLPGFAFMAAAVNKDVIVTDVPVYPGAPTANDLQTWINTYLDPQSNAAQKEGARLALKAAFDQHQSTVERDLDAKLDAAILANENQTVSLLQSVLGPIRVRVGLNKLKVSVRFMPATVARFGVAFPENDPLAHFSDPNDPRAKAIVVPPDGDISVKPQVIEPRRTITVSVSAVDLADNLVLQWTYVRPVMIAQIAWTGVV